MKKIIYIFTSLAAVVLFYGCDQGIDDITRVDPGADVSAPQITINYPLEGTTIKVLEAVTSITVDFEVTDDIEVANIEALIDGNRIAAMGDFLDYRRVLVDDLTYNSLDDGTHEFTVKATDIDGKTTSVTVNFMKEPAYVPIYAGETLYMPFDGDYFDLVGLRPAEEIGSPGFLGEGFVGLNAYAGATDSYLSLDSENLETDAFTAVFWYKLDAEPNRAGILVIGPEDTANAGYPDVQNNRNNGFRFFRENRAGNQSFRLNVGNGTSGVTALPPTSFDLEAGAGWTHFAFSITATSAKIYVNGELAIDREISGIDWTGCDVLSIMSGAPRFTGWNHFSDLSAMDELRMFNRELSQGEIENIVTTEAGGFVGTYDQEMFYMPFDGDNTESFSGLEATMVGTTGFAGESVAGENAFAGAADSYLTLPTNGLTTDEFSATFWYKMNADPTRGGIIVMGPEDTERAEYPDIQNLRTNGFRFFREGNETRQVFKLNVGVGDGETWIDGGDAAALDPTTTSDWVHMAFTISGDEAIVYFNGVQVAQNTLATGIDWTGCDLLSIGSGAPRFNQWNHLSDPSFIDELRFYSKVLSPEDIINIMSSDL